MASQSTCADYIDPEWMQRRVKKFRERKKKKEKKIKKNMIECVLVLCTAIGVFVETHRHTNTHTYTYTYTHTHIYIFNNKKNGHKSYAYHAHSCERREIGRVKGSKATGMYFRGAITTEELVVEIDGDFGDYEMPCKQHGAQKIEHAVTVLLSKGYL